jgi:hypothetical protein
MVKLVLAHGESGHERNILNSNPLDTWEELLAAGVRAPIGET